MRIRLAREADVQAIASRMGKVYIKGDDGNYYKLVVKSGNNPKLDVVPVEGTPSDGIVCNEE